MRSRKRKLCKVRKRVQIYNAGDFSSQENIPDPCRLENKEENKKIQNSREKHHIK